jgi:ATP-binding cassette, subfamily B, bacterial
MFRKLQQAWHLRRALHLVWQSSPRLTLANLFLALIQGILPLLSLYLTKLLVDTVSGSLTQNPQAIQQIIELVVVTGIIALFGDLCNSLNQYVTTAQSQIVTDYVHNLLHKKSVEVDLEYYENAQFYNALHMAQQEAPYRPSQILDLLIRLGQSLISLVAIAALLISLHWLIALVLFITAIPSLFIRLFYARKLYHRQWEWTPHDRRADYYNWMLTSTQYAKEIRLFTLGDLFQRRFLNLRSNIRRDKLALTRQTLLAEWGIQVFTTLAIFTVFGLIAYQAVIGAITVGSLVMYYQAFQRGQTSLRDSLTDLASLYENSLFLASLYEFLDLKRTVAEPIHPIAFPQPIAQGIRFENVRFNYPGSSRPLLDNINLTIRSGETIALVGENGAGKTTLIKLLCRLYDPTRGKITVDGIDFTQLDTTTLRQQISVVFQDYMHYNLTAAENIGLGDLDQLTNTKAIESAAQKTGAEKAIARLPHGYDTILGREYEEGEELSIGEWQKVAIARAFLRQGQIVVLDEPTSALDARAEYEVFEQFRKLAQGRTAILISHRLSTVKLADRIYMLKDGKIAESGTHAELMQLQGAYAELFELQASSYLLA